MILNISGRTDIVAFYTDWFIKRYEEGYIDVRNPFYPKSISRITFDKVDAIVFCTKNPLPIIPYLKRITQPIIFHVTITPYHKDIEPNVIDKKKIINGVKQLSKILGKENIYVRYDPILLNKRYTVEYHLKAFDKIVNLLDGYVNHMIISFIDEYKNVRNHQNELNLKMPTEEDYQKIGISFAKSAKDHHMTVQTCYEKKNLVEYGFLDDVCISKQLAYQLTGKKMKEWKARNCHCVEMADIGQYNTCPHLCKYCYANYDEQQIKENLKNHDQNSSLLIGRIQKDDIIKTRKS